MHCSRAAYDVLPFATGLVVDGVWTYANPVLTALLGRDLAGARMIDVVTDSERAAVGRYYDGCEGAHSTRWVRADGSQVLVEVTTRSARFGPRDGLLVGVVDLSARELLFDRLDQSEQSFRALVDASPDPMFVHGSDAGDYEILWVNPAMVRLLGYHDASELLGRRSIETFVHPDDRGAIAAYRDRVDKPPTLHVRWLTRDGDVRHMEGSRRNVRFADMACVLVVARDRTDELVRERERAAADAALRESEAGYRLLFDGSPVPISVFDSETFRYVAVNDKMCDVYGYTRAEFLAMTVKDIKVATDVPSMVTSINAAPIGLQKHIGVMRHRRKDGALIDVDITSHQLRIGARKCSLAIGIDVTETRRIEDQLRQAQKMEAIGQLAGGVAHDFNNLLAVILSTTSFLREELGDAHRLSCDLADVESAAERAAGLTRQLLAFSRKQPHTPKLLSLRSVVENVEKMLRRIVGEDVEVSTRLGASTVEADAGQLEQVIMNLVVNARDAMPTGGRLAIETAAVDLDDSAAACVGVAPGAYAMLSVSDSGCGMDEATKRRLFEPFFTTKEVGRGTGLGLATVFGIVKQARGGITVYSEPGRGSTFRIYLPRVDRAEARSDSASAHASPLRGTESILLVEDDAQLRAVIQRRLRSLGYTTIEAHDAISACEAIDKAPIDMLLTDLVMPGIDGRALASQLLLDHPALKVVFMSGYSEHVAVKTAALGPNDHFIEKPFTASELSIAVRRALEDQAPLRNG